MNKLTLDEIGFIKKKIEQFVDLPASPKKLESPNNLEPSSPRIIKKQKSRDSFSKSPKKTPTKQSVPRNPNSENKDSNQAWLSKKQKEIEQFISHQNRNKQSVLNRYLNSDKIHLKKREEIQPHLESVLGQISGNKTEKNLSDSFSFDDQFSSLKKVYKNLGSLMGPNQTQLQRIKKTPSPQNIVNPFVNLLKGIQQDTPIGIHPKKQVQQKPNYFIETQNTLIKPSAIKGKFFFNFTEQNQTPRMSTGQNIVKWQAFNKQTSILQNFSNKSPQKLKSAKEKYILKSDSQVSLQKNNKHPVAAKRKQSETFVKSTTRKDSKYFKVTSNVQSKTSFQPFFDSENVSTIRESIQKKPATFIKDNSSSYYSPIKNFTSNQQTFPRSVYKKSFKQSPYVITSEQKYFINKYRAKQISPDEKSGLKQKYELLDKRLGKILTSVKNQKNDAQASFSSLNLEEEYLQGHKTEVPEEVMTYQKLSPLKKFLKINKEHRNRFQTRS